MRKLLSVVALSGLLGFTACTDPYGNVDPLATGLLAAGIGVAAGLAVGASSQPRYGYYAPAPRYGYYAPPPSYGWGRPSYAYARPGPGWGHGRGHGYGRRYW